MTNIFKEKKFFIFCYPHIISIKGKKTESVYLILKNNYGFFSKTRIFQKFPQPQQQK